MSIALKEVYIEKCRKYIFLQSIMSQISPSKEWHFQLGRLRKSPKRRIKKTQENMWDNQHFETSCVLLDKIRFTWKFYTLWSTLVYWVNFRNMSLPNFTNFSLAFPLCFLCAIQFWNVYIIISFSGCWIVTIIYSPSPFLFSLQYCIIGSFGIRWAKITMVIFG